MLTHAVSAAQRSMQACKLATWGAVPGWPMLRPSTAVSQRILKPSMTRPLSAVQEAPAPAALVVVEALEDVVLEPPPTVALVVVVAAEAEAEVVVAALPVLVLAPLFVLVVVMLPPSTGSFPSTIAPS